MRFRARARTMATQNPVILVPGIFGSIGNSIIPGTGKMRFGPAKYVYDPVMDNLEEMGYKRNENLFVCYYNWRRSNEVSAKEYLIPIVEMIKKKTGANKVDIVAHSMGGLVARSYIQSKDYKFDVDKLILAGTPNAGSPSSYYFCAGGKLPYDEVNNNFFLRALWEGFVWYMQKSSKGGMGKLENVFPSATELLPCRQYGDYIFSDDDNKELKFVSIKKMKLQNDFLSKLNDNKKILNRRNVKIYQMIGYGFETDEYICIKNVQGELWKDGKPVYSVKTVYGDGRVTCDSCKSIMGKQVLVESNHTDLLKNNKAVLAKLLNRPLKETKGRVQKNQKMCNLLINSAKRTRVKINGRDIVVNKFYNNRYPNINVERIGVNNYWVLICVETDDDLKIKVDPMSRKCNVSVLSNSTDSKINNLNANDAISRWISI